MGIVPLKGEKGPFLLRARRRCLLGSYLVPHTLYPSDVRLTRSPLPRGDHTQDWLHALSGPLPVQGGACRRQVQLPAPPPAPGPRVHRPLRALSPGLPRDTPLCVCPTISEASDWPTQCLGSGSRSKQWPVFRGPAHRPRPLVFALIWAGRGGDALNLALGKATPTGVTERAERSRGDPSVTGGAPASRKQSRASPKGAERGRASGLVNRCHGGRGRSCGRRRGCRRPAGPGQPPAV